MSQNFSKNTFQVSINIESTNHITFNYSGQDQSGMMI